MIRPKQAGALLATGVLLPLLVLAMHPTGHDLAHDPHGRILAVNHLVHGIAIACVPLLLAGLAGLCAWLRWSVVATLAFATYCLATALQASWLLPLALVLRASTDADQVSS